MRKTLVGALALSAAAHAAFAQEAAADKPKAEARAPRIAVINLEKVWSDSLMGKGYAAQMEALANDIKATETKKQTEVQKMEAAIKALQEDFENQQAALSPDALERKRSEIDKKQRELQRFVEDKRAQVDPDKRGMGTTCSVLLMAGDRAFIAHVGDSRVYLARQNQCHVLTEDHSLMN